MIKTLFTVLFLSMPSLAFAESLKTQFLVKSQTGEEFFVEAMVLGIEKNQINEVQSITESKLSEFAGQFLRVGFINNRQIAIRRLEKAFKKGKLSFDGIGILVLVKKDNKVVDIE